MELATTQMTLIEPTVFESAENQFSELNDFQLALVGGGVGEVTPH